jgi:hypothetical protein
VAGTAVVAHHRHRPHEVEARRVERDEDHAGAPVRRRVRVGDRHDDRHLGADRARGEPLVPVDHPLVALALGPGGEVGRVRAGALGLGHREAGADLALEQGRQPAHAVLPVGEPDAVVLVGQEQVPKALGLGPLA